jgi:class 3 adenylate cyclase
MSANNRTLHSRRARGRAAAAVGGGSRPLHRAKGRRFPRLRVGVAFGAATNQRGRLVRPVNVARRVTAAAKPRRIRATDQVVDRSDGFE